MPQAQNMPIPVTRRISFQLAKKGFIAALCMAMILGISQTIWEFYVQKKINKHTIQEIMIAIQEPSSQALFNGDKEMARIILGGLIKNSFVTESTIIKLDQSTFLSIKNYSESDSPYRFITRLISEEFKQNTMSLEHPKGSRIGTLKLTVDNHILLLPLFHRAVLLSLLSTIVILIVCIIMFAVFQRYVTDPMAEIISSIRSIDPSMINNAQLNPLKGHEKDELGLMITIANEFIRANAHHINERIAAEQKLLLLNEELEQRVKERTDRLSQKIIQHEHAEKQLRLYEKIVSSTSDMIGLIDRDNRYILVNESYIKAFGRSKEELIGKTVDELFGQEMKAILEPRIQRCFNGETMVFETWYRYPKIGERFMSVHYSPWIQDDIIENVVVSGRDITRLKRIEEQLDMARTEAEEANKSKSEFLARMSHEIRTPLNAIIGLTHLVMQTHLSGKQLDYLKKITTSSKSLLAVINDILDFSKIEAGKLTIESVDFKLDDILEKVSSILSIKAHKKGLELIFEIDPDVPNRLVGDPLRLGQVLTNLINNAIKFTEHGEIILRIRVSHRPKKQKAVLIFSVIDTGIGMSTRQIKKLFKSFSQADHYITRKFGGSGLGLSICKGLIEIMGGSISVSSIPGKGSTFSFECPFNWKRMDSYIPKNQKDTQNIHILLVDNNETSRTVFKKTLTDFSFQVTAAANADESLKILTTNLQTPFSLILVNFKMPDLNGIELTKQIKKLPKFEQIPIILMVTAFRDKNTIQTARSSGIDIILSKPIKPSTLLDSIMSSLNQKQVLSIIDNNTASHKFKDRYQLSGKILLVEDNDINQEVADELLQLSGFKVKIVSNGQKAFDEFTQHMGAYDAILMDIQMPVMDGFVATKLIRKFEEDNNNDTKTPIPIIAMTAHAMAGEKQRCLSAGMNDYTTKPIDPDILIQTLCRWIPHLKEQAVNLFQSSENAHKTKIKSTYPGLNVAAGLLRIHNQESTYLNILNTFVNDFIHCADSLQKAFDDQSYSEARHLVHNLKGVSGNIGAERLFESCCVIEKLFKKNALNQIPEQIEALKTELDDTIAAIQSILKEEAWKSLENIPDEKNQSEKKNISIGYIEIPDLLTEFDRLLQQHHLDAEQILDQIRSRFTHSDFAQEFSIIAAHMARYDYVKAHKQFLEIKGRIQETFNDTREH